MKRSCCASSSRTISLTSWLATGQPSRAAFRKMKWYTRPEISISRPASSSPPNATCQRLK